MAFSRPVILLLSIALCAFSFNHPELKWKTVSTEHFLIHYYDRTEVAVFASARIAEEVYEPLAKLYDYTPAKGKIHISLADYDDYTNGFAEWTADNIQIWLPDDRFDLRSNTTWLRNVITHELAHIISLSKKGTQLFDWVVGVGYEGPSTSVDVQSPIALTPFYPAWFAEGTAQRESERAGNDCWDSRRDMVLRCAALDGRMLSLDEMACFNHDGLGDELVYNQGFSFIKYLEEGCGAEVIASLWKEGRRGKFGGGRFTQLFADHTGRNLDDVYGAWRDSLRAVYAHQAPAQPTSPKPVWTRGRFNDQPRSAAAGPYWGWLTSDKDDYGRTDLLVARAGQTGPAARMPWAKTSWCFSRDGTTVFYLKSRDNNEAGSFYNDVFAYDLADGSERRITAGGRVYDITALPDGKRLLCVRFGNGAFSLDQCAIETGAFACVIPGILGQPFQGLSINPIAPSRAVTSRIIDGQANIYIVNIDSGSLAPLCQTVAQEESPCWAADGRVYFSADYDGIYNIYSIRPDGADLRRHTTVTGGAFSPSIDAKERLLFSEYTSAGFRIVTLDKSEGEAYELPNTVICAFQPLPSPRGKVRLLAKDYKAERLRAVWEMQTSAFLGDPSGYVDSLLLSGDGDSAASDLRITASAGFAMNRSDALQKKMRFLGLSLLYDNGLLASNSDTTTDTTTILRGIHAIERNGIRSATAVHSLAYRLYDRSRPSRMRAAAAAAQAAGDSSSGSQGGGMPPIFLFPQFAVQNRTLEPTLTLQIDALAYLLPIPILVEGLFDTEWHVARDWYLGLTPMGFFVTLGLYGGLQVPLWLSWQTYGYVNEDIAYNLGGVSELSAYVQPGFGPMAYSDTAGEIAFGFDAGVAAMHAFPIAKYISIVESFDLGFSSFIGRYFDPLGRIDGLSRRILAVENELRLNFPVFRNINSGRRHYAEDLYGRLFYAASAALNEMPMEHPSRDYLLRRSYDNSNARISHTVGLSAVLGTTKSYAFSRSLEMTLAYDWWNYRVLGKVSLM